MNLVRRAAPLFILTAALAVSLQVGCINGSSSGPRLTTNGFVTGTVPAPGSGVAPLQVAGTAAQAVTPGQQTHGVLTTSALVTVEFKNGGVFTTTLPVGQTTFSVASILTAGQDALVTISQNGVVIFQQFLLGVPASGTVDVGKVDLRSSFFVRLIREFAKANGKGGSVAEVLRDLRMLPGTTGGNVLDIAGLLTAFQSGQLDTTLNPLVTGVVNGTLGCTFAQIDEGRCSSAPLLAAFQSLQGTFNALIPSHQVPAGSGGSNMPAPPPMAANETAATIGAHVAGTYDLTFNTGIAPFPSTQYTNGQMQTFIVGTDGTLTFGSTVLTGPVLRNMNPHEAIWKDPTNTVEYALSSIVMGNTFNEINVFGAIPGTFNEFQGQFRRPAPAALTIK